MEKEQENNKSKNSREGYVLRVGKDGPIVEVSKTTWLGREVWRYPVFDDDGNPLHTERSPFPPEERINAYDELSPTFYQVSKVTKGGLSAAQNMMLPAGELWRKAPAANKQVPLSLTRTK